MAKVEAWYKQDLKRPVRINYLDGSFFNQDAVGSRIGVKVYSDGEEVTLAGSITGYCVQADGTTVPVSGTRSGNTAYVDIPQSALSVPGPLTVTIKNTESSVIATLCAVVGIVTQSRTGVQVDPGQTVTDWTNQISAQLQACQDAADNVGAIVAVPYASLTFPVEVGTYTTNSGNLYCCTTRIETSESFTAAHWRQTRVCNEISDLKSAFNSQLIATQLASSNFIRNYYIGQSNGKKTSGNKYAMLVPMLDCKKVSALYLSDSDYKFCLAFYNDNGDYTDGTGYISAETQGYSFPQFRYEPKNTGKIGVSFRKGDGTTVLTDSDVSAIAAAFYIYVETDTSLTKDNKPADAKATGDKIAETKAELEDEIEAVEDITEAVVNTVETTDDTVISKTYSQLDLKGVNADGSEINATSQSHISLNVSSGDIISVKNYYTLATGDPSIKKPVNINAVCAYAGETIVPSKGVYYSSPAITNYTVPDGIDSIIVTFSNSTYGETYNIFDIITKTPVIKYFPKDVAFGSPIRWEGNLTVNTPVKTDGTYCVNDCVITFDGRFTGAFGEVTLGNYYNNAFKNPKVWVTDTKVFITSYVGSAYNIEAEHGLTITNDLQIIIIYTRDLLQTVIVQSGGERWASDQVRLGDAEYGFAVMATMAMTDCSLSASVQDINQPVWVCGDSWVTNYDSRWYGQAITLGLVHFLKSGIAGQGSYSAIQNLKTLLKVNRPKTILWMLGMNDADTDDSTVNAYWKEAYDELIAICSNYSITLILATIPTTPTRNNNAKNAIVTASGYRYVDQVKAMGADTSGNWISGYQSEDGNHPTEKGAKALLARVLCDAPEVAIKSYG